MKQNANNSQCTTRRLTFLEHLGGVEGEVGGAPGVPAAAIDVVSLVAGVGLALEAGPVNEIDRVLHTTEQTQQLEEYSIGIM